MQSASWRSFPVKRGLGRHLADWDVLNASVSGAHPMFDSRFVDCLLKYFAQGDEVLLRQEDTQGKPGGLCIVRPKRAGVWTTFLPAQAQIAPLVVEAHLDLHAMFAALPAMTGQLDLLCLDSQFTKFDKSITHPGSSKRHSLTASIELSGNFETYWHGRSRNLTSNIRRYQHRVQRSGNQGRMIRLDRPEEMAPAVERYGQLESSGWKGKEGTAVARDNCQGAFYRELLERFAASGQASVYEFWIGEQIAASRLVISNQSMLIVLKTAFAETMAEFAPGRLLLYELVRDAFARFPGGAIEFYTRASHDQLSWATHSRAIDHLTLFRSKAADLLSQVTQVIRRRTSSIRDSHESGGSNSLLSIQCISAPRYLSSNLGELFKASETKGFDLGLPWFKNYFDTIDEAQCQPLIYAGSREEHPVAAMPIRIRRGRMGDVAEGLSNYYSSLYAPILSSQADSADVRQLLGKIAHDYPKLVEMRFAPLDPCAFATTELREAIRDLDWFSFSYFCFGNWYLPINACWEEHQRRLGGQVRSTIKRMSKKFASEGGQLEVITHLDDSDRALQAFQSVYAASWKVPEPYPRFMPGLIRMLAKQGFLRLGIAWLRGAPIAAQVWIVCHGKASIYKLAYHEEFSGFSPGTLLTAHLLEHVIDVDNVQEVDYLIGDDTYKQSWMTHRRERWGLVAYNPRSILGLTRLTRECAGRSWKWLATKSHST